MRKRIIAHGMHCKTWVAIVENSETGQPRQFVCRCLACGEVKTIRMDRLRAGTAKRCKCNRDAPLLLPHGSGASCRSRVTGCPSSCCPTRENYRGYCCYYCELYGECAAECKNTPDKCGSFYYKK